jgi:hypothetical protein
VACLTGTGHFSGSFTVPTYEQTDEEKTTDERTKENGGEGREGQRTAEGGRRTRRRLDGRGQLNKRL